MRTESRHPTLDSIVEDLYALADTHEMTDEDRQRLAAPILACGDQAGWRSAFVHVDPKGVEHLSNPPLVTHGYEANPFELLRAVEVLLARQVRLLGLDVTARVLLSTATAESLTRAITSANPEPPF